MRQIRVVLWEMSPDLLEAVRREAKDQPDMKLVDVDAPTDSNEFLNAAGQADIVLMGLYGSELPEICRRLFSRHPHVRVLAVSEYQHAKVLSVAAVGRPSKLVYELRPHRVPTRGVLASRLIDAIRATHATSTDQNRARV